MFENDNKKAALLILAKKKNPEGAAPGVPEEEPNEEKQGLHAAAEDIMSAVKAGDTASLAEALHSFYEMCQGSDTETEPE